MNTFMTSQETKRWGWKRWGWKKDQWLPGFKGGGKGDIKLYSRKETGDCGAALYSKMATQIYTRVKILKTVQEQKVMTVV